jgi:hypothetical protein
VRTAAARASKSSGRWRTRFGSMCSSAVIAAAGASGAFALAGGASLAAACILFLRGLGAATSPKDRLWTLHPRVRREAGSRSGSLQSKDASRLPQPRQPVSAQPESLNQLAFSQGVVACRTNVAVDDWASATFVPRAAENIRGSR